MWHRWSPQWIYECWFSDWMFNIEFQLHYNSEWEVDDYDILWVELCEMGYLEIPTDKQMKQIESDVDLYIHINYLEDPTKFL